MFRPHEAGAYTVLFPEFKQLISKDEYNRLGDVLKKKNINFLEKMVLKKR